ncbi:Altered inheritance of mitochondria protein 6 [Curvularia kusanoi]|uniref:Altered inheritance of mitochondria protein 6 n=1 Tax=Curvularia kusanoi TaxID=90978 RepID=A0A9P4W5I6_CURKU|nr:Altered inheritance of mitochondria protein 6 [Curvularia kusanoi]
MAIILLAVLCLIVIIVYSILVALLLDNFRPSPNQSGLQRFVQDWRGPSINVTYEPGWRDDFSRDIVPKKCHSHNDYWRLVPLYSALAAGCTSVEADVWLAEDGELLVSHSWKSTKQEWTLNNLYLKPLWRMFNKLNVSQASDGDREVGLFDRDPNVSVVLLIDFKNDGHAIWPAVLTQLQPFRERNWLTFYDGDRLHRGPLTIVGTGNTPLELVLSMSTDRFVFFDAPLTSVSNITYNYTNSYYASASLKDAIGKLWLNRLSVEQEKTIKEQIETAGDKSLESRYWDTPQWPISVRDMLWFKLTELGVGALNVDDLAAATRWNWHQCVIAGLTLC